MSRLVGLSGVLDFKHSSKSVLLFKMCFWDLIHLQASGRHPQGKQQFRDGFQRYVVVCLLFHCPFSTQVMVLN